MRYLLAAMLLSLLAFPAAAQDPRSPEAMMAAQREAMAKLDWMDGVWRGQARVLTPQGWQEIVQTERVGDFLDGTVKLIEGRGYNVHGDTVFNALGIVSYDPESGEYVMRSYALGRSGTFDFDPAENGYSWSIPAGPGAQVVYTARLEDGRWHQSGARIAGEAEPMPLYEMTLDRVGDSDWPAAGAVPMEGEEE